MTAVQAADDKVYLGECQLCEGRFHLHGTRSFRLVHHGYRRPGDGRIHGDCGGVGHAPYDESRELCEAYRAQCMSRSAAIARRVGAIERCEVTYFTRTTRSTWGPPVTTEYALGVTPLAVFERARITLLSELNVDHAHAIAETGRMTRRIDAWRPRPVQEASRERLDEEAKAERKARHEAAQAAREAKQAKARALIEKRAAREAERGAILQDFGDKIRAAAEAGDRDAAFAVGMRLRLKKYHWIWLHQLKVEDELLRLGFGRRDERGYFVPRYPFR